MPDLNRYPLVKAALREGVVIAAGACLAAFAINQFPQAKRWLGMAVNLCS